MTDKYYFPVHVGMLTEQHRERIGKAIWEFLWCLSKTTQEITEDDHKVGVVLGGMPVTYSDVIKDLGGSKSTIKRNLEKLELENYITLTRTPRGQIIKVMISKRCFKKEKGAKTDHSNKDIKQDITITTTTAAKAREEKQLVDSGMQLPVTNEIESTQEAVIKRYLELRGSMHPSPNDLVSAKKIEQQGVPAEIAVKFLQEKFAQFEKTKKWDNQKINSLSYCEGYIIERYLDYKQSQEDATDVKMRSSNPFNAKSRSAEYPGKKRRKQDVNNELLAQLDTSINRRDFGRLKTQMDAEVESFEDQKQPLELTLEIDGRQFAKATVKDINTLNARETRLMQGFTSK